VVEAGRPFAFLSGEHVVTTLRGALFDIFGKSGILLVKQLLYLILIWLLEPIQRHANIYLILILKGRNQVGAYHV
jgi:hypothetical protein